MATFRELIAMIPPKRFAAAVVGALFLTTAYIVIPPELAKNIVRHGGYWCTLIALAGVVAYGVRVVPRLIREHQSASRSLTGAFAAVLLGGSIFLFAHASFGPKVLMDDEILVATGKNLHQTRELYTAKYGRWIENTFVHFNGYVDKRPWLYPFAVSLTHDLTGYRMGNPYVFNAVCGLSMLAGLTVYGYLVAGLGGAYLVPLLWLTIPLFGQNATGGGMDMVNVFMILMVMLLAGLYLERPSSKTEGMLSLTGVLLAHGRYESLLFLLPVAVTIVAGWFRAKRAFFSLGTVLAAPLLTVLLLQNKFFADTEALWELHSGAEERFSTWNIVENFPRALNFFFNPGDNYANSLWISLFGFSALIFLVLYFVRERRTIATSRPHHLAFGIFGVFLAVHMVVILCYHDGALDRLFASRFALPFYLLLTVSIAIVLGQFTQKNRHWQIFSIATVLFIVAFTLPMSAKGVFTKRNFVASELQWLESIASAQFDQRALVIDIYTVPWTLREYASLSPLQAFSNALRLDDDISSGKFTEVYLVERREFEVAGEGVELKPSIFPPEVFDLELMRESSFKPFQLTRLYRLRSINRPAAKALLETTD